jgi:hypothetical protein
MAPIQRDRTATECGKTIPMERIPDGKPELPAPCQDPSPPLTWGSGKKQDLHNVIGTAPSPHLFTSLASNQAGEFAVRSLPWLQ